MNAATISSLFLCSALVFAPLASAQDSKPGDRIKQIRELAKQGQDAIAGIAAYAADPSQEVRLEAVKQLGEIGGPRTQDSLVRFTRDNDPEIQMWATDALVDVYLPGYLKSGISRTIRRAGDGIRAKFGDDPNDQVIDGFVNALPAVQQALGRLARGGASMEVRANAARALGILHARDAIPDLIEALYSRDDQVMYESLVALQKMRDPSAGPKLAFLVRDLSAKVQLAALGAVGVLRTKEAAPDVRYVLENSPDKDMRKEALTALAMIAEPADHDLFVRYLQDRDDDLRAAGAEGLARIANPQDEPVLNQAFGTEHDTNPRLSMAFALVAAGRVEMTEFSPLRYLVNTLNRRSYRNVALAFLTELARNETVRQSLYPVLPGASKDERIGLSVVLGRSGGRETAPYLEALQNDPDPQVSQEALRSLRALDARLP